MATIASHTRHTLFPERSRPSSFLLLQAEPLRSPVGIPSYSLAFNRKVMPQLRPVGGAATTTAAFDDSAELNFNYRVLSTCTRARRSKTCYARPRNKRVFVLESIRSSRGEGIRRKFFWKDPLCSNYRERCLRWSRGLYLNMIKYAKGFKGLINREGIKLMSFNAENYDDKKIAPDLMWMYTIEYNFLIYNRDTILLYCKMEK